MAIEVKNCWVGTQNGRRFALPVCRFANEIDRLY